MTRQRVVKRLHSLPLLLQSFSAGSPLPWITLVASVVAASEWGPSTAAETNVAAAIPATPAVQAMCHIPTFDLPLFRMIPDPVTLTHQEPST